MKVQGYIEIDNKKMSDEEFEEFNKFLNKYFVNYQELSVINGREYDSVIIKDVSMLEDKTDENGETTYGLLSLMKDRNIVVNGIWDIKGIPYGQKLEYEQQGEGETQTSVPKYTGIPLYNFNIITHLKHTPDEVKFNEEGNEISRTKVTKFKPLHQFGGWGSVIEY